MPEVWLQHTQTPKPDWFLKVYADFFMFVVVTPSWKHYPLDIYIHECIIQLRMRSDRMDVTMLDDSGAVMVA